ncbi:MAG: hypothetical protein NT049_13950 [Planctomycetota bacterium]|nr:hypothetical protein [Planctomycetota bacterium]
MRITGILLVVVAAMFVLTPVLPAADGERGPKVEKPRVGGEGNREAAQKTAKFSGLLTEVQGTTLTLTRKTDEGGKNTESKTFNVDAQTTKIFIETDQMESVPGEGGKTKQRAKVIEGTLADLKIGQQVDVAYLIEGTKAVKVLAHRPPTNEGKKEGEGAPKTPKPEKPRSGGPRG